MIRRCFTYHPHLAMGIVHIPICCFHIRVRGVTSHSFFGAVHDGYCWTFLRISIGCPEKDKRCFFLTTTPCPKNQCELRKLLGSKQTSENSYHHFSIGFFLKEQLFVIGIFQVLMANSTAPQTAWLELPCTLPCGGDPVDPI